MRFSDIRARYADIRSGTWKPTDSERKQVERTTFRDLSLAPRRSGRHRWAAAERQMALDVQNQQPKRSRRQRLYRKPRVGRWP